jgi:hypothetical protein
VEYLQLIINALLIEGKTKLILSMTTLANLSKQGQPSSGVTFNGNDQFSFNITQMNAVIADYNAANNTSYPQWDSVADNYEKLIHFIAIYSILQNLALGNDTFNIRFAGATPQNQLFGTRGSLNSRIISLAFPFSSGNDVVGDSDNLG